MNNHGTPPTAEEKAFALEELEVRIRAELQDLMRPRQRPEADLEPESDHESEPIDALRASQFNASDFYNIAFRFIKDWQRHRGEQFELEFRMMLVKHAVRYGGFVFYAAKDYNRHFSERKEKSQQSVNSDKHAIQAAMLQLYFDERYYRSVREPLLSASIRDTISAVLEQFDADVRKHNDFVERIQQGRARRAHLRTKAKAKPKSKPKKAPAARRTKKASSKLVRKAARTA